MKKCIFGLQLIMLLTISVAYNQTVSQNYIDLQKKIASGWNTWSYGSMLTHVLLPEGLSLGVNFRLAISGTPHDPNYFLNEITVDKSGLVRPIAHSFDGAYTEVLIEGYYSNDIRVQSAAKGNDVVILVTPVKSSKNQPFYIELQTGIMWNRPGTIRRTGESIVANFDNQKEFVIRSTKSNVERFHTYTSPYLIFKGDSAICFYTGDKKTLTQVGEIIASAKNDYENYAHKYGDMAEAFKGIQSVLGWNTLYDAGKNIVITPVTRAWNEAYQGYVLFEWDTYFAALLFALDNKDFAYSNAIAITNKGDMPGHVGFFHMPGLESTLSQPPVGSMICWIIYEKYKEKWFLEEVYNELLNWNRWWLSNRLNQGYLTWGVNWKNAAVRDGKLESGLDNSPMYEGLKMQEVGDNSLFNLADVGLNSMYVADCKYLAKIAKALGKDTDASELLTRADTFTTKTNKLWNDKTGIYQNRFLDKPKFSKRLAPTLFYPMIGGIASKTQARRMLKEHYYNTKEFYGDYIIPSCARNDKSYNNDYWRGAIWGPMNWLVYMGLRDYDKEAATDLANKSYNLYMKAWSDHHYVFENINSMKGSSSTHDNKLNSDPYYHWGSLMGIMKFMEEGKYNYTDVNSDFKQKK